MKTSEKINTPRPAEYPARTHITHLDTQFTRIQQKRLYTPRRRHERQLDYQTATPHSKARRSPHNSDPHRRPQRASENPLSELRGLGLRGLALSGGSQFLTLIEVSESEGNILRN